MREIKFRAWDKEAKQMFQIDYINFHVQERKVYSVEQVGGGELGAQYSHSFDKIEIMQYTGLKDKNGKEIYEGDIVSIKGGAPYEVEYDYEWLGYQPWRSFITDEDMWMSHNIEIIGNIYENPELLKV